MATPSSTGSDSCADRHAEAANTTHHTGQTPSDDDASSGDFRLISVSNHSPSRQPLAAGSDSSPQEASSATAPPPLAPTPLAAHAAHAAAPVTSPCVRHHPSHGRDSTAADDVTVSTKNALSQMHFDNLQCWMLDAVEIEQRTGVSFADSVRGNLQFNNPAICDKMIAYCKIDPNGTHLPSRPTLNPDDYYDKIDDLQQHQLQHP